VDLGGIPQVLLGEAVAVEAPAVPDGNAVAPPELAADAPVLDVIEPVQVDFRPALGVELDEPVADGRLGLLDPGIAQPPLPGEARLDRHVGALGVPDAVLVGSSPARAPDGQELRRLLAGGEPVHPA
jgi:hypothetical protein